MIIGVPKEIKTAENRVAMTPTGVAVLVARGHRVQVEKGAGLGSGLSDRSYEGAGATLLDSAMGCAAHTTCLKGEGYITLELKINLVRAITRETGLVRAEGRIIHRGRTVATAEGHLRDGAGRLYAHATTTCMIFPAK